MSIRRNAIRTTAVTTAVLAGLVAGTVAADPAAASPRPRVEFDGLGTSTFVDAGTVTVQIPVTGRPFDGTVTARLSAKDGTLPEPGQCEPAKVTLTVAGPGHRFARLTARGDVCGHWLQPPTSVVTHVFTGRYLTVASSRPLLVGTDGWLEIRLADGGVAATTAVDT